MSYLGLTSQRVGDQQCECSLLELIKIRENSSLRQLQYPWHLERACLVRCEGGGSGCKRDCWAAVSDPLVAERSVDRIPLGGGTNFSEPIPTGAGAHTASCTNGYRVSFLWLKRPVRCVGHPLPSIAEVNRLNPELNPICYLLALLGAHHFLHVSRIRVKLLTFRLLRSYIYMEHPFLMFLDHTQRRSTVGRTPLDE